MSKQNKYDDLIKTIKADEEKADAQNELTATLEEIKEGLEALKEMRQSISEAMANGAIVLKGLNAATASADNIINGICSSIIKAQNTKIKVGINDKGLQRLDERNNNAINGWSGLLGKHETKSSNCWQVKEKNSLTSQGVLKAFTSQRKYSFGWQEYGLPVRASS